MLNVVIILFNHNKQEEEEVTVVLLVFFKCLSKHTNVDKNIIKQQKQKAKLCECAGEWEGARDDGKNMKS